MTLWVRAAMLAERKDVEFGDGKVALAEYRSIWHGFDGLHYPPASLWCLVLLISLSRSPTSSHPTTTYFPLPVRLCMFRTGPHLLSLAFFPTQSIYILIRQHNSTMRRTAGESFDTLTSIALPTPPAAFSLTAGNSPVTEPSQKRTCTDATPEGRKEIRAHRNRIVVQNSRHRRKALAATGLSLNFLPSPPPTRCHPRCPYRRYTHQPIPSKRWIHPQSTHFPSSSMSDFDEFEFETTCHSARVVHTDALRLSLVPWQWVDSK